MKLLVRNLARTTSEQDLRVAFSAHGNVTHCNLVLDQETGKSKGFAFVEMPEDAEGKAAIAALNMVDMDNQKIRVKVAKD